MAKVAKGGKIAGAGRKGGTRFPNYSLKQIIPHLKDLISKTHGKSISIEQLNAGVFKVKATSPDGGIKYSSLKQFGLAEGEYSAINAKQLASNIELSFDDEKNKFLVEAFFNVAPFRNAYETYQGSTINKSKIRGYSVSALKVHPDLADKFIKSFIESAEVANLCTVSGDDVTFANTKIEIKNSQPDENNNENDGSNESEIDDSPDIETNDQDDDDVVLKDEQKQDRIVKKNKTNRDLSNITIRIDSHTDHEKLDKQLSVLKKFGLL